MAILEIDIGYGETKFMSNGRYGIFPTTLTLYKKISFGAELTEHECVDIRCGVLINEHACLASQEIALIPTFTGKEPSLYKRTTSCKYIATHISKVR